MAATISTLADISTIWLVLLSFILCLVPLAIFGALVYGMRKVLIALPPILKQGQQGMATVARETDRITKKIAEPFIVASASASQVKGTLRGITNLGGKHDLEE
jgi:hypothetical protein